MSAYSSDLAMTFLWGAVAYPTAIISSAKLRVRRIVAPLNAQIFQFCAQTVHIEPQITGFETHAILLFFDAPLIAEFRHLGRIAARHHTDAVDIGHNHVTRM